MKTFLSSNCSNVEQAADKLVAAADKQWTPCGPIAYTLSAMTKTAVLLTAVILHVTPANHQGACATDATTPVVLVTCLCMHMYTSKTQINKYHRRRAPFNLSPAGIPHGGRVQNINKQHIAQLIRKCVSKKLRIASKVPTTSSYNSASVSRAGSHEFPSQINCEQCWKKCRQGQAPPDYGGLVWIETTPVFVPSPTFSWQANLYDPGFCSVGKKSVEPTWMQRTSLTSCLLDCLELALTCKQRPAWQ